MPAIITSLLDTDLYKFTMWQAMLHRHPQTQAQYEFVCRNTPAYPLAELLGAVNTELDRLCELRFTQADLDYLGGMRFIKSDFIDFLRIFQFQRAFISASAEGEHLRIVARGPQVHVMGFEIFVLSIVNELYFRRFDAATALAQGRTNLARKIAQLQELASEVALAHPFELFDFGVRR
ncbi:MAG: nicotinate phosphoribosyltransferase, partial [Giesbergeria sp.]